MSTDFSDKLTGAYSMEDADVLVVDGTVEIEPGSNQVRVEVTSR